jgi:hypothetical protein
LKYKDLKRKRLLSAEIGIQNKWSQYPLGIEERAIDRSRMTQLYDELIPMFAKDLKGTRPLDTALKFVLVQRHRITQILLGIRNPSTIETNMFGSFCNSFNLFKFLITRQNTNMA